MNYGSCQVRCKRMVGALGSKLRNNTGAKNDIMDKVGVDKNNEI